MSVAIVVSKLTIARYFNFHDFPGLQSKNVEPKREFIDFVTSMHFCESKTLFLRRKKTFLQN